MFTKYFLQVYRIHRMAFAVAYTRQFCALLCELRMPWLAKVVPCMVCVLKLRMQVFQSNRDKPEFVVEVE